MSKRPWPLLLLGFSLILGSPLIVMMPEFTSPAAMTTMTSSTTVSPLTTVTTSGITTSTSVTTTASGTSTISTLTTNFPNVTYPFIMVGVGVGVIGSFLAILGYIRLQRVTHRPLTTWPLGCIGLVLVLVGFFLVGYPVRGSGWVIALYEPQGVYLFVLGIAVAFYAILSIRANQRSAIMLSVGIILAGFSLLSSWFGYTDFEPRCDEIGCNYLLARSTVFWVMMLGLLLAFATFLMGYGTASFRKRN